MTINELKEQYNELLLNFDEVKAIHFRRELCKTNENEILEFHYNILKKQDNKNLFYAIRGCFDKHGELGKKFLLRKINEEKDNDLKAEALFLLGTMDCKEVKPIAIDFLKSNEFKDKYYGIIVLGWLGQNEDISILEKEMMTNSNEELRAYAATSLRQIYFNYSKLKEKILFSYYKALKEELSNEVIINIIACIQDLIRKKFGIKESQEGDISGDAISAKAKAIKYLDTIIK